MTAGPDPAAQPPWPQQKIVCPAGVELGASDFTVIRPGPRRVHADGSRCEHPGQIRIETRQAP